VQQKGYPNLQTEANALTLQASQLSGRDATPAEQAQNQAYLSQVHNLLNTMSYPAKDVL
jgi:cell division protein FtsB